MFLSEDRLPQARQGDLDAFGEIVRANHTRLFRLLVGLVGHEEDARDLAQVTWLKAWQKLATFRGESAFSTWVFRIATRLALDHRKYRRRHPTEPWPDETATPALGPAPTDLLPPATPSPRDLLERHEIAERFHQALAALPPPLRAALVLREVEGLSYAEIAHILGCPPGTVMSRIFTARKALQSIMGDLR